MTDLDRPLGLRYHLRSAAAACEGTAQFWEAQDEKRPSDEHRRQIRVWHSLCDLFNEAAEVIGEGHEDVLDRVIVAAADALIERYEPGRSSRLTDDPCGHITTPAGTAAVNAYRAHRTEQHPRPRISGAPS